jgi:chromosome segregation ATPase
MAEKVNHTLRLLNAIRDRLDAHEARLESVDHRLESVDHRLESVDRRLAHLVEGQTRMTTELVAIGGTLQQVVGLLRERLDERHRVDDHEDRIRALEKKVG